MQSGIAAAGGVGERCLAVHPWRYEAEGEHGRPTATQAGPTGEEW
jgi:hypothetical protein